MSIQIETPRLHLREFTEADLPALVAIASQPHILKWCSDWADCGAWVRDWYAGIRRRYAIGDPNVEFILLAIEEKASGRLVGQINTGCELKEERPGELSIGYFIAQEAAGRGYATEAARGMTEHFFAVNPNDFFYALIEPGNAASVRVAEKAGFVRETALHVADPETGEETLFDYYRLYRGVQGCGR